MPLTARGPTDSTDLPFAPLTPYPYPYLLLQSCVTARGPTGKKQNRQGRLIDQYKTMVTSMDFAIGTITSTLTYCT